MASSTWSELLYACSSTTLRSVRSELGNGSVVSCLSDDESCNCFEGTTNPAFASFYHIFWLSLFAMWDILAFSSGCARRSSPYAHTAGWEFHSYTTEALSGSSTSLLHETRTMNLKSLHLRKTSEWKSLWKGALYNDPTFSRPAVRIFLNSHP